MERPWLKFYTRDWRSHIELGKCSAAARGLWIHMMCLMHESNPYGHLSSADCNGLAHDMRLSIPRLNSIILELENNKVFSRNKDGLIFSRRMVKDEEVRLKRAAGGNLGGNPNINRKVNLPDNLHGAQKDNLKEILPLAHACALTSVSLDYTPQVTYKKKSKTRARAKIQQDWLVPDREEKIGLLQGCRDLWKAGACSFDRKDEEAIEIFMNLPVEVCRKKTEYAAYEFSQGYWVTKPMRFRNFVENGRGNDGTPVRTLPTPLIRTTLQQARDDRADRLMAKARQEDEQNAKANHG